MSKNDLLLVFLMNAFVFMTSHVLTPLMPAEMWGLTENNNGMRIYSKATIEPQGHIEFSNHIENLDGHYEQLFCEGTINWQDGEVIISGENLSNACIGDYTVHRVSTKCLILESKIAGSGKHNFFICDD
ncbi:hypothetical protein M445_05575 [Vibrio owensii 47666-1]|uniref:hypothetical protein n=1 Tax=Vibrio owensii TaxID=696485 RepID=UPI000584E309|nr:hypothetical protein [Vibrio owensii]KIF48810.1 hypothetical protein M445_05575 [Vibrio owensii 47666-1]